MTFLRLLPNQTVRKIAHANDCPCNLSGHFQTFLGVDAFKGKDARKEIERRSKKRSKGLPIKK